jgi:hypothetical protein
LLAEWDEMKKLYRGPYIDAFEENLIIYLGVIALFLSNFQNFNTFRFFSSKTIRDRR